MQMQPMTPTQDQLRSQLAKVETVAASTFPELFLPVKAALAVAAIGCLKDNTQPTALVFVGPSGAGKTLAVRALMPKDAADSLNGCFYRSDKFTAASFVTHIADRSKEQLAEIDLLPKIEGKTLLTAELAPFFRGREQELAERFAIIARVLDGQGYVSDSGAHGRRGYERPVNFQWIGATTPLSDAAIRMMAGVGPRMLFYGAERRRKAVTELAELARRPSGPPEERLHEVVREFLRMFYATYPPNSLTTSQFMISDSAATSLALWADVLSRLRAPIGASGVDEPAIAEIEYPERVMSILRNIAIGSALIHLTSEVSAFDLWQVRHIALSSGYSRRSTVFAALLASGGSATSSQIERLAGVSRPTALAGMRDLHTAGLAQCANGGSRSPSGILLRSEYGPLLDTNSTAESNDGQVAYD